MSEELKYQSGFGNHFQSEAVKGSLPGCQNSPQTLSHGLYAEQLSGSSFTAPRAENLKTWFYKIRPSVVHSSYRRIAEGNWKNFPFSDEPTSPNQYRWDPLPEPKSPTDFIQGLHTFAGNGNYASREGSGVHLFAINQAMTDKFLSNSDGEMLLVPEKGGVLVRTECGNLKVEPTEILLIPRGMKFQVSPTEGTARGYVCENFGQPFVLPNLGPIGSNGLANPRHFLAPTAAYEDKAGKFTLVTKFQGNLWECDLDRSPLDVVAWAGNYVPYKYDLKLFNTINSVSFDHPDPSIFTVLTSPSHLAGTANLDFVIFPPRWMVAEKTFRPPYYHRNVMSEFMGLIKGVYDAKAEGFSPGGSSLHNSMSAHGPDADTYEKATKAELKPQYLGDTLAFMFESSLVFHPTPFAMKTPSLQKDYLGCWKGLKSHFKDR